MQEAMNDAQEVFGENPANNSNTSKSGPNVPDFMKKPPIQKGGGLFVFITNFLILGFVYIAWVIYGMYYVGAKAVYFIVNVLRKK